MAQTHVNYFSRDAGDSASFFVVLRLGVLEPSTSTANANESHFEPPANHPPEYPTDMDSAMDSTPCVILKHTLMISHVAVHVCAFASHPVLQSKNRFLENRSSSNNKLLVTGASLVVTGALLVVTRSY